MNFPSHGHFGKDLETNINLFIKDYSAISNLIKYMTYDILKSLVLGLQHRISDPCV